MLNKFHTNGRLLVWPKSSIRREALIYSLNKMSWWAH